MSAIGHAIVLGPNDMTDRPGWLEQRRRGIGGSDAAAICGLDHRKPAFSVWLDKVGLLEHHRRDLAEENEAMRWGQLLESVVREETARREGVGIEPVGHILAHPDHDWMLASPDGIVDPKPHLPAKPPLYEGKTASAWIADQWADDKVPESYLIQGQHYLEVCGLDSILYGCLIGGQRLVTRWVLRDQDLIDHLVDLEAKFWHQVQIQEPPDVDGSKATTDLLAHLWDVTPDKVATIAEAADVRQQLAYRASYKARAKELEELAHEVENNLKLHLEEAEIAQDPEGRILFTWKRVPGSTYTATRKATRRFVVPTSKDES